MAPLQRSQGKNTGPSGLRWHINSGNLYGTTYYYGRFAIGDEFEDGGTLFKITP